jgi:hypothetical protein
MLTTGIHSFVKSSMGQKFVESPPLDLEVCYSDSTATTPLIFVLSPGSDPMSMLLKFAERLKCQVRRLLQDGAHNEACAAADVVLHSSCCVSIGLASAC